MSQSHPQRILVAVDFGDPSAAAVHVAGALARRYGAALFALHAESIEMPPYFTADQMARLEADRQAARTNAEGAVQAFVAAHTPAPAETVVADGVPADVILGMAWAFDLVVVGTHGRRGVRRWWLGSVAEAVVRSSPVPVLVVHAMPLEALAVFDTGSPRVAVTEPVPLVVRPWLESFGLVLAAQPVLIPDLSTCSRELLERGDMVLVSGGDVALAGPVSTRLASCQRPVLIVPGPVEVRAGRVS